MNFDFGTMIISLDFELLWGILDHSDPLDYKGNVLEVRNIIPRLLEMFERYGIHATWGTVGLIARDGMSDCKEHTPAHIPGYADTNLSPYEKFDDYSDCNPKLFFAPDLIEMISSSCGQELGSHTYSHYYCCESGQDESSFSDDLDMFLDCLKKYGSTFKSIIFPRNQLNEDYSEVLKQKGFINYRGNEKNWFNAPCSAEKDKNPLRRAFRLADNYINVSGHNCYSYSDIRMPDGLNNMRSSRFLRPYSRALSFAEPLRMRRIKKQMKYAATHNMVFHMWWHPHNFGSNTDKNFNVLEELLKYFCFLRDKYGMRSMNMGELGDMLS